MSSHPQSSSYHRVQQPSTQPKRFNGFLGPSHSNSNSNSDQRQFQFNNLFGTQQQTTQAYQFSSSFTDDELIDSLIHHHHQQQQPTNNHHNSSDSNNCINHHQSATLTQPISFDQINLSHQPPANSNGAHHPIPIATSATSPDTERHASFSSSLPIEEHQLLLSPSSSSTHPSHAHSPSTISQLSSTHHTLRSSRSPQPKPLNNQHANYPFSPPTSITTTLVDEDRSPAISTISVCESTTQHSLSCSQPIGNTFYRPMTSADDSAVKSPIGRMSDELFLSTSLPTRRTFSPHAIIDQHKIILDEKRRKRRESHNAVERRRRDNINDRITELAELLPSSMLETVVTPNESGMMMVVNEEPSQTDDAQSLNPAPLTKPNKGVILAKSVDYIKHLQYLLELQHQRNTELEAELRRVRSTTTESHNPDLQPRDSMIGDDGVNVKGKGIEDKTCDQIHEWLKIHDQRSDSQKPQSEGQNKMMVGTETQPYRALLASSDRHLPSDSDCASLNHHHHNPQTFSPSEHFKSNNTHLQSSHAHFSSPFDHHFSSLESIYHQLQ